MARAKNLLLLLLLLAPTGACASEPDDTERKAPGVEAPKAKPAKHGHTQLQKLLADRPKMRESLEPRDPILRWATERFEGSETGFPVYWDASEPLSKLADHAWESEFHRARIRIRSTPAKPPADEFELLWSLVVYELLNLEQHREYDALYRKAIAGSISRSQWIRGNGKLEWTALRMLVSFYETKWKKWSAARGVSPSLKYWAAYVPERFEDWASVPKINAFLQTYWGGYYDKTIVPFLRARGIEPPKD